MRRLPCVLALATFLTGTLLQAQTPPDAPLERGFHADSSFQIGDIDNIDLFRGSLEVVIPLGQSYSVGGGLSYQLKLAYHSDIWDIMKEDLCPLQMEPCWHITAKPQSLANAGFGWMLNFATLLPGSSPTSPIGWKFIGPDGAEHVFYDTLHGGETVNPLFGYTRDASYLRWVLSTSYRFVETPDGTQYWFEEYDTVAHKWRLFKIQDTFNNRVQIAYDTAPGNQPRWTISDTTGRSHTVLFDATHKHVVSVDLAAFGNTRAVYSFQYAWPQVHRPCFTTDTAFSEYLNVPPVTPGTANTIPFLTRITLPDGSSYAMLADPSMPTSTPTYYTCCPGCFWVPPAPQHPCSAGTDGGSAAPGVMKKLWLPTGGAIAWTFADNTYEWEEFQNFHGTYEPRPNSMVWSGVQQRELFSAAGASLGMWSYTNKVTARYRPTTDCPTGLNPGNRPEERTMVVKAPDGNATAYYFRAYPGQNMWLRPEHKGEYALPYTRRVNDFNCDEPACDSPLPTCEGRFLSVQHFLGDVAIDGNGATSEPINYDSQTDLCGGSKSAIRRVYRSYTRDPGTADGFRHGNRHLLSEHTIYEDGKEAVVTYSNPDGLGHPRQVDTAGTFDAGNVRTTKTNYNPNSGTYPGVFHLPSISSPWVITTYDYQEQTDDTGTARQQYCFDTATGFLTRVRTIKEGTTEGQNDLLAVFTADSQGNRIREQYYGGDTQSFSLSSLCTSPAPTPDVYRIDHTYQYGTRRTSRYVDTAGTPLTFYTLDLDVDQNTGLPSASYQASTGTKGQGDYVVGIKTDLEYDSSARFAWEKPTSGNGAWTGYAYTNASGTTPARATVLQRANGSKTGAILAGREYEFDPIGRLSKEKQLLSGQTWPPSGPCLSQCNQRVTTFDLMGRKTSVSEWQSYNASPVYKTEYLNFDLFGRPGTIRPPDGSTHDVTIAYTGIRQVDRTVAIATAQGTETPVTSSEEYDRQGRLWKVKEYSDPVNPTTYVTTTYTYDVGNRLKQASTTSGVTQNRIFTYDKRGFLLTEQLPEVGASGNGTVTYSKYDARGHNLRKQDAAHDLAYTYDRAERLTQVAQGDGSGNPSTPVLTTLAYATTNNGSDKRNGKLLSATSANPDLSSGSVVETYVYAGLGGRVSSRQTGVESRVITQSFTWNDLGLLAWQGYADDSVLADPARTVINAYSNGFLTGVCEGGSPPTCTTNYVSGISYHANGMVNQVTHANNTKVLHGKDPFDMGRPAAISLQRTADSSVLWQTGTYAYDGAGNVKQIGSDWYTYDKVNRLSMGTTSGATKRQCASYNAFGTINGLGTGTTTCSASSISVDNATNRMTEAQGPPALHYDAAGNMTAWGGYAYSWDRLNQMLTTSGTGFNRTYAYTTDGERMVDRNNQDSTRTLWIRDLSGKVLREYSRTGAGTWSWSKDYVYRNGLHAATVTASATRHFALDHLGTLRRGTDTQATPQLDATLTRDFYPFGLEATSATGAERMRFTGHQRDTFGTTAQTDDLDYMHARYYNPNVARFLSTDPVLNLKRTMKRPQAWNRYAYVLGNPMKYVDPTGEIFKLAGCGGADTSQCDASKAILKQALGDAYQYVNVGKGGIVTLAGISAGGFANLGTFQKGLGALMGSNNTFTLFVGSSPNTSATNPAQTTALRNFLGLKTGDARIDIDPRYLPQSFGNVPQNAATSLVHEVGHGAGMLFPAQATMVNNLSMGGVLYRGEGYPTTFENRYRSEAGLPLREYYLSPGDYTDPGDVSLFP